MNYMPRLCLVRVIVMTDSEVIEQEDRHVLVKSEEDLNQTVEVYKDMFKHQGQVFVRTDWLTLSYSTSISNELSASNAEFIK